MTDDKSTTDEAMTGPLGGPVQNAGRFALNLVQTVYDVPHERPWGWKVSTYLWTKSIGAGMLFIPALLLGLGGLPENALFNSAAAFLALGFVLITTIFLVWDLKRPERFLKIILRPQWRSWLTVGAFILMGYSLTSTIWLLAAGAHVDFARPFVFVPLDWLDLARGILNFPVAVLGIFSAIYSAFLFSQAEGRDLWQSPLLPLELFMHATIAGSGALLVLIFGLGFAPQVLGAIGLGGLALGQLPGADIASPFIYIFIASVVAFLATKLIADFFVSPPTTNARMGHHAMVRGEYAFWYWTGIALLLAGLVFVLLFFRGAGVISTVAGALFAIPGLWSLEHGWVQAGQAPPNS